MESSRIFVRGLPPGMKEAELRQHFSSSSPVTDAKFIPHRRIGYVGYKTSEAATKAVKYFNRSFIRMSRINVELARPVDEMRASKRKVNPASEEKPVLERKGGQQEQDVTPNPKLEAFLDSMKAPSKGNTWSNEDPLLGKHETTIAKVIVSAENGESDDDYQHTSKKRKTSPDRPSGTQQAESDSAVHKVRESIVDVPSVEPVTSAPEPEEVKEGVLEADKDAGTKLDPKAQPPASDADWLRSRTNRVLDLLDDEDLQTQAAPGHPRIEQAENIAPEVIDQEPELVDVASPAEAQDESPQTPPDESINLPAMGRLFVRNLPYDATEQDLMSVFSVHGTVEEVHIAKDNRSGSSKGFGYVQFEIAEDAERAREALDGKPFQGRLLHILNATAKRNQGLDDIAISKLPLKVQNQIKRKAGASADTFKWNSMYMSADAIMSSVATRLGVSKSDVLDPTSSDAAVKQAHAETNTIQETKKYLQRNGVDLEAFKQGKSGGFSETVILVKNFPFGTTATEIKDLFEKYGQVRRLLVPPTGTIAIVDMEQPAQARAAFKPLAYSKFKDSVLYLEKAPKLILKESAPVVDEAGGKGPMDEQAIADAVSEFDSQDASATSTLYVRNLNFSTTTEQLRDLFRTLDGFLSAKVKTRTDSKRPGEVLSMGFGFVEFRTKAQAQAALAAMNGYKLAGHELVVRASHKAIDAAEERRKEDREKKLAGQRTKIIIKNLPFEVSRKDVRALFSPYGQLRSVRVPKKFDSSSRGFAFADFVTTKEAANAMEALRDTHLLGRRLVLSFAAADTIDPEDEIARMQEKTGRQVDKVAVQKLTSGGRKKFRAYGQNEAGEE